MNFTKKCASTLEPRLVGTRRILYREFGKKGEEHEKNQSEIDYIRSHSGAIIPFGWGAQVPLEVLHLVLRYYSRLAISTDSNVQAVFCFARVT